MTKKDYVAIAAIVSEMRKDERYNASTLTAIAVKLADHFQRANKTFNKATFFKACL